MKNIFRELIPLLEDGQVIHIFPITAVPSIFRKLMREMNCTKNIIVGAWYTALTVCVIIKRGGVPDQ